MKVNKGTVVAIIRGVDSSNVCYIQEALLEGGINWIEVSLSDEENGLNCIRLLTQTFNEEVNVGVGTVMNRVQVDKAISVGAKYIITPGWDRELVQYIKQLKVEVFPGVFSPGEIMQAINEGMEVLKLFPVGNFHPSYIQNLRAPFPNLHLMGVGGVTLNNILDYYQAGCSSFAIGSDLVPRGATKEDRERIRKKAEQYVSLLKEIHRG